MESNQLLLLAICCCLPLLMIATIGGLVGLNVYSTRQRDDPLELLAGQMGLTPHPRYRHRYVGTHQDRAFEIAIGGRASVSSRYGKTTLRISLELQMKALHQGYAGCNRDYNAGSQESFESAFKARLNYEWVSEPARAAMLDFVRRRASLWLEGLKPNSQPEAKMRLEHNMDRLSGVTLAEARAALDDLIEVARVIETTC